MVQQDALDALTLPDLEEASGELHRRIGVALRRIGEGPAEQEDADGRSPRWRVASLVAAIELACTSIGAAAAGSTAPDARQDRHPAIVSAVMYAAPSIPALLGRLDQDRRMLASLARTMGGRLGEGQVTPWGHMPLRRLLTEIAILEPARCAQLLERRVEAMDREAAEAAARERPPSS